MTLLADRERDIRDWYEERAALIEFDGGASRLQAEAAARRQTAAEFETTVDEVRRLLARAKAGQERGA